MYMYCYHVIIIICYKVNVQEKNSKVFFFFFLRILNILTHTNGEKWEDLKETNNDIYPKGPNS